MDSPMSVACLKHCVPMDMVLDSFSWPLSDAVLDFACKLYLVEAKDA